MSLYTNIGAEYTVGIILIATSAFGTVLNTASFVYFKRLKTKNRNSEFFKKLYMAITINDILICLALFPAIDAVFTPDRQGLLDSSQPLCAGSFIGWWVLSQNSVISVALLSMTRLLLLKNPSRLFFPNVAFILPVVTFLAFLLLWIAAVASDTIYIFYNPNFIDCTFNSFSMQNESASVSISDQVGAIVAMTLYNSVASTVFNVVTISFVMSLLQLKRSSQAATRVGGKTNKQREAAKTVVIVTFLYILCNVPFMMVMMYVLVDVIKNPAEEDTTVGDIRTRYFEHIFGATNVAMNQYVCLLANKVFVSLNSAMNPVVYYFRIDGFRRFVSRVWSRGEVNPGFVSTETSGPV